MLESWNRLLNDTLPEPWMRSVVILALSLVAAWVLRLTVLRMVLAMTSRTKTELDDKLVGLIGRPIFLSVVLAGALAALVAAEVPAGPMSFFRPTIKTIALIIWLSAGLRICTTLLQSFSRLADRVSWLESRTVPLFDNLAKILIFGAGLYSFLVIWNLDVKPWLASAGVVGLAVGFAAKDSLANLFGGFFVIVDAPYKIGDYVVLDQGERGQVTKIGLRSTRLLTRDDVEITIPNAQIANSKIINETGGPSVRSRVRVNVGVAYGSNVGHVKQTLMDAVQRVELALPEPDPRVRFRELGDSALNFQVLVWIEHPEERGRCVDRLLTEIYEGLNQAGITIPFPQRDVHLHPASASTLGD